MKNNIRYKKKLTFKLSYIIDLFVSYWLNKKAIRFKQNKMVCYSGDTISTSINLNGVYEKRDLDIIFEFFESCKIKMNDQIALDIGANIGNHSIYFKKYFKKVIAFEPIIKTFNILKLNVSNYKNIEIKNFGLSSSNGTFYMETNKTNIGGSRIVKDNTNSGESFDFFVLDDLKIEGNVGLIKIDVEGHEYEVLKGSEKLIKNNYPIILFELNKNDFVNGKSLVYDLLKEYGYSSFLYVTRSCKIFSKSILFNNIVSFIFSRHINLQIINNLEVSDYSFIIALPQKHETRIN